MKDILYNQINPIVRIEESRLLQQEFFEKMIQAESFQECKDLLKSTVYAPYIEQEDFDVRFEYYLREESARVFQKIYELAPEKEVVDLYTMRYSYHNLKLLTKAHYTKQNLDEYWINDGKYSMETMKSAIANHTSASIGGLMMESIQEVSVYLEEYKKMRGIDIIYDRYYLKDQRATAEKLGYAEITKEVIAFIDLTNIFTTLRGIRQHQTENFMSTVLSSSGSIPKKELLAYVTKDMSQFTVYLQNGPYKEVAAPLFDEKTQMISPVLIDREKDDYLSKLYEPAKTQAFGPLPLLSLLNAQEIEGKNLQLILSGKKNHFSRSQIRERMRKVYV